MPKPKKAEPKHVDLEYNSAYQRKAAVQALAAAKLLEKQRIANGAVWVPTDKGYKLQSKER